MKLKAAVAVSLLLHGLLFGLVVFQPATARNREGMTYYVDLIQLGGGTGDGRPRSSQAGADLVQESAASVKKLTVEKKAAAALRYPSVEGRRRPDEEKLVTVVRKPLPGRPTEPQPAPGGDGGLTTGISAGGTGTGGSGTGGGDGWAGAFPYAYYVEMMRNRIASSWYSALVAPGLRGRHLVTVYFIIQRNGRITDLKVEKPSAIDSLDLSALRAVSDAAPFAPLPGDFTAGYLVVHFEFEWEKK
jgi:TonB family protein